jgi:ATP-dependent protease ClpP protease subunit
MSDTKNFLHIADGEAFICGEVNEEMHANFHEALTTLADPPTIIFSTHGGDVEIALGIFDLVRKKGNVTIVANGICASAGTLILQAASRRASTPSTQFLVHFGSESAESEAERKHNKTVEEYWLQLFHKRVGGHSRKIRKWHAGETFFNAQQALKEGLIDEVV